MYWRIEEEKGRRINLTFNDIWTVRNGIYGVNGTEYGMRSQPIEYWMYPWNNSWVSFGYIPGAYSNLSPAIAESSYQLCVAYADANNYWTRILTKKGMEQNWTPATITGAHTTTGVTMAYNGNKYVLVHVGHIYNEWGATDHRLFFQTSTDCLLWSPPQDIKDYNYWPYGSRFWARGSGKPAISWSPQINKFVLVYADYHDYLYDQNSLYIAYMDPKNNRWRVGYWPAGNLTEANGYTDLKAVGAISLLCRTDNKSCVLSWRDDSKEYSGHVRSVIIDHVYNGYDYEPRITSRIISSYTSSHGVGNGTFYAADPDNTPINYFRIIGNLNQNRLEMLKIFGNTLSADTNIWDAVNSCIYSVLNTIFAVGVSGLYDYK